jgi:hypothetical protein
VLALAGLLLGFAGLVRSVGAPFVAVFVVYLAVRRLGWRSLVAFVVPWVAITAAYAALFDVQHDHFALNLTTGRYLYGQVAPFADCSQLPGLPADERAFCPDPAQPLTSNGYLWSHRSPIHDVARTEDGRIRDFALRVIRRWPGRYANVVATSFIHYFRPGHPIGPNDYAPIPWQFPLDPGTPDFPYYRGPIRPHQADDPWYYPSTYVSRMVSHAHTNAGVSRFLRGYQRVGFTQGPLLAACVLVAVAALFRRGRHWRLRLDGALLAAAGLSALLLAALLSVFSYRYVFTAVVLLPPAAALSLTALLRRD